MTSAFVPRPAPSRMSTWKVAVPRAPANAPTRARAEHQLCGRRRLLQAAPGRYDLQPAGRGGRHTSTSSPTISPLIVRTANPRAPDKERARRTTDRRPLDAQTRPRRIEACSSVRYCGQDSNPAPRAADPVVNAHPTLAPIGLDDAPAVEPVTELNQCGVAECGNYDTQNEDSRLTRQPASDHETD
jgi:hypothetical protein